MSTRSQIIVRDNSGELWFYRHSDGYPSGNLPTLRKFLQHVKDGKIRDNVEQAAGWLVILGAQEYLYSYIREKDSGADPTEERIRKYSFSKFVPFGGMFSWKVGAYEPCSCRHLHGDVEFLYTIDLQSKTIKIKRIGGKEIEDVPGKTPDEIDGLF